MAVVYFILGLGIPVALLCWLIIVLERRRSQRWRLLGEESGPIGASGLRGGHKYLQKNDLWVDDLGRQGPSGGMDVCPMIWGGMRFGIGGVFP